MAFLSKDNNDNLDQIFGDITQNELIVVNNVCKGVKYPDLDLKTKSEVMYKSYIPLLRELSILKLEKCKLQFFEPINISPQLRVLSLRENKIRDLNRIIIGTKNDEFDMEGVNLFILDLSSNLFEEFPFTALCQQKRLKILDMSRNRITQIQT